jgi:hypothetical protein
MWQANFCNSGALLTFTGWPLVMSTGNMRVVSVITQAPFKIILDFYMIRNKVEDFYITISVNVNRAYFVWRCMVLHILVSVLNWIWSVAWQCTLCNSAHTPTPQHLSPQPWGDTVPPPTQYDGSAVYDHYDIMRIMTKVFRKHLLLLLSCVICIYLHEYYGV